MPSIRRAASADLPAIERIVRDAYSVYLKRLGKPPGPMLDDYAAIVAAGRAFVVDEPDHMLLNNVAVAPGSQGRGFGRALIDFAEGEARARGFRELRLYTHERMTENIALYRRLGFEETHRGEVSGYARVFMRKRI
jgi:ribosomal protein S18 acetylase RimI-like enzyme